MFLKMSLSGGILIILVIILRHILNNHIPKRVFMFLWYIAAIRLIVPVWLPFKYGILLPVFQETASNTASSGITANSTRTFSPINIQHITTAPYNRKAFNTFNINIPFVIWITGTIVLFTVFILLYFKEYRIIREALPLPFKEACNLRQLFIIPVGVEILTSDRITTPLAAGIIHPKIIFPKLFMPDSLLSLKYIITHELIHIKRADNLWKMLILSTVCLHWFNPLVWIMYFLFNKDLEISCDEKVISVFGNNAKKDYALSLVNFAEKQCKFQFFSNGFGKNPLQERIEAIMKYKKLTVPGAICAAILLCTAVTVFAKGSTQNNTEKVNIQKNTSKTEPVKKESLPAKNSSEENNQAEWTWSSNNIKSFANSEDFKKYEKFGLSYNADTCHLMYNGKIVGYFHDETDKNVFTHIIDEAGKIGIKVKRNSDNEITGFEDFDNFEFISKTVDIIKTTDPEDDSMAIEENDIYVSSLISGESGSASSSSDEDNSALQEKYKKYGITYDKASDTFQYKGKNIAGLIIYQKTVNNDPGNDKIDGFTTASGMEIYTNDKAGKNSAYFIIDSNGTIRETAKKEFNKILEG